MTTQPINVVFDGPPSHESGRFIEVETDDGRSINAGEWIERPDGLWSLRISDLPAATDEDPFAGWITAKGGIRFDLLNPTPEQLDIRTIAHALGNVCRFSGHTRRHFSVAQHSVLTSHLVALLGGTHEEVYAALMHDAQEAYVGDMPTPLKRLLPEYRRIEDRLAAAVAERFHVVSPLPAIVKQADLYALYLERDELMPEQPEPWEHEHIAAEAADLCTEAVHQHIVQGQWAPEDAADAFLIRFAKFAPEQAR